MVGEELHRMARRRLDDYDRRTPGRSVRLASGLTHQEAYELQAEVARLRERRGEKVIGFKVGCTSRTIQEQLGMDGPIFGRLFDTECHRSGARLSYARYANLAVEGELAVRLSRDLDGNSCPSDEECLGAIESVFPVVELHHYVLPGARAPGPELIASGGMHAGFVLAETETETEAVRPGRPDPMPALRIRMNGAVVASVDDPRDVVDPLCSLRWLAGRLAEFGLRLARGQVILTGSTMRLFPTAPGCRIAVEAPPLGRSCAEIVP
jgi:2-keto-4-pentenoate hydratase